jgi:hypothetical protein
MRGIISCSMVAAMLALHVGAVPARPATYQCGEERQVRIDFTPRQAQLHLGDQDHTLQRVKSARDGHYLNRKAGYELIANKGDLRLREGKIESLCKLKVTP